MKLTKKRQEILDKLKKMNDVCTAKQLHAKLPDIDLVTIYRALELFVKEGVVKRVSLEGSEAYFEFQTEPHHHAVCVDCKQVVHFTIKEQQLKKLLPLENFKVDEVELTVRGHCRNEA